MRPSQEFDFSIDLQYVPSALIAKLHAVYNKLGRFGHVNPVSISLIKEYLRFTGEEQADLAVTQKQAAPPFFTKFKSLIGHFRK